MWERGLVNRTATNMNVAADPTSCGSALQNEKKNLDDIFFGIFGMTPIFLGNTN